MAVKAISLLSGGLDSTLATRMMKELGFDIVAVNFTTPFCTCTTHAHGCKNEAKRLADELGIPSRIEFMGEDYLKVVREPKFGYGKGMNPCIDCRIMVFSRTKEIMKEEGAAFIFTGEVIGQRPMSQQGDRMKLIDREAGLEGYVVRPLCAKLLAPTIPEERGIIDREKMLAIQGRSRKEQIKLAKEEFGMTENLCSSGGCLLTDKQFAGRMDDLMGHDDTVSVKDARLLRLGRHFRLAGESKLIVGRNHEENEKLRRMATDSDFIFYPEEVKGPLALLKGIMSGESLEMAGAVTARYCDRDESGDRVSIAYHHKNDGAKFRLNAEPASEDLIESIRI